jgi:hypothetical protein
MTIPAYQTPAPTGVVKGWVPRSRGVQPTERRTSVAALPIINPNPSHAPQQASEELDFLRRVYQLELELVGKAWRASQLRPGWDGIRSRAPGVETTLKAIELGRSIIRGSSSTPESINMHVMADGRIMFSVDLSSGGDLELVIEDSGEVTYLASRGEHELEGKASGKDFGELLATVERGLPSSS